MTESAKRSMRSITTSKDVPTANGTPIRPLRRVRTIRERALLFVVLLAGCVSKEAEPLSSEDDADGASAVGEAGYADVAERGRDGAHEQDASGAGPDAALRDSGSSADPSPSDDAGAISDASRLADAGSLGDGSTYRWDLPAYFPRPFVPKENPMSEAKVELGRRLFYDTRLSKNGTFSCASCHKQELAFTDALATAVGSTGQRHPRGSQTLANVAYSQTLTWANPLMTLLERQVILPILGDQPVELGNNSIPEIEERFRRMPEYGSWFRAAFPADREPISMLNLNRALASFQRSIISADSPYDRYLQGEASALSESAKRGMLFVTTEADPRFNCARCHGGFNFTDHVTWEEQPPSAPVYHQTGLYDLDGQGSYPGRNTGVHDVTGQDTDMGKYKAPTLRNIALTAPYMHDGSIADLSGVLDHYALGGRARNAQRTDPLIQPFAISAQERADMIAFLESLTDRTLLTNPSYGDPWLGER
jgi:cytochrome c peroxidase